MEDLPGDDLFDEVQELIVADKRERDYNKRFGHSMKGQSAIWGYPTMCLWKANSLPPYPSTSYNCLGRLRHLRLKVD